MAAKTKKGAEASGPVRLVVDRRLCPEQAPGRRSRRDSGKTALIRAEAPYLLFQKALFPSCGFDSRASARRVLTGDIPGHSQHPPVVSLGLGNRSPSLRAVRDIREELMAKPA